MIELVVLSKSLSFSFYQSRCALENWNITWNIFEVQEKYCAIKKWLKVFCRKYLITFSWNPTRDCEDSWKRNDKQFNCLHSSVELSVKNCDIKYWKIKWKVIEKQSIVDFHSGNLPVTSQAENTIASIFPIRPNINYWNNYFVWKYFCSFERKSIITKNPRCANLMIFSRTSLVGVITFHVKNCGKLRFFTFKKKTMSV